MRKVIVQTMVSLEGFFEGPNKELDWHVSQLMFHRSPNFIAATSCDNLANIHLGCNNHNDLYNRTLNYIHICYSCISEVPRVGVIDGLSSVDVLFCANTELWLTSIVVSMTVNTSSIAVSPLSLKC